jgi:hypothetical protein
MKAFVRVHGIVKCSIYIAPFFRVVFSLPTLVILEHQLLDDVQEYFQFHLKPVNTTSVMS